MNHASRSIKRMTAASGLFLFILLTGCSDSGDIAKPAAKLPSVPGEVFLAADSPKKAYVKTAPLTLSRHPLLQPLAGKVTYNENQTARISSPIAGRVTGIPVALGTQVRAGTALLELNSPDAAAAQADFARAQADLTLASRAFKRQQELFAGKAIAKKELELAQDNLSEARSELQRSQNRLQNLQLSARQHNGLFALRSPLAGSVVERNVTPGMEVRPDLDSPLFVVSDISTLTVLMEVFEVNLSKIKIGQSLSVSVPAYPGESFPATVQYIGQVLDEATRTVQVRCDLPNPDSRLLPGMYATISVDSNPNDMGIMVPLTAVFTEDEANYVFIQLEDNHFQQRKVELALRLKDKALITSGVNPGELLVTEGALMLRAEEEVNSNNAQP
ncbi:efflux RND transporter periplasmic adaptor subunit [Methylomonas methanica]|uniref:Efflux transporter, RND family, MFP subunit n=1 Tax=Methylomonas methanica (strain DSM 25384 / MC09) TaxID=857087 RepID=F9ZV04_METMM|nr:efflux RND transporter periplasmic adaptor subunit [Methylomonas methanica]AEF99437.1 efflux transporter, RND family, MFP subunit [Methylomonas methanica MC09]